MRRGAIVADDREGLEWAVPDLRRLRCLVLGDEQRRLSLHRDDDEAGTTDLDEVPGDEEDVLRHAEHGHVDPG